MSELVIEYSIERAGWCVYLQEESNHTTRGEFVEGSFNTEGEALKVINGKQVKVPWIT